MSRNLTLSETIAHRNPEVANQLLIENGYPHSANRDILAKNLNHFLLSKEGALQELANIHPDRNLIYDSFVEVPQKGFIPGDGFEHADGNNGIPHKNRRHNNKNRQGDNFHNCCGHSSANGDDSYSNCAGCGGSCGMSHFSADGNNGSAKQAPISHAALVDTKTLAIVGVIGLITIALITIAKKQ